MSMEVRVASESFTPEQRREIALCYMSVKSGQKAPYTESLGMPLAVIRKWISTLTDGDLDNLRPKDAEITK